MKRLILFTMCLMFFLGMSAQTGYYYGGEFVELKADSVADYIPLQDTASDNVKRVAGKKSYKSLIYHTSSFDSIYILPRIIVCLEDGINIEDVLASHNSELSVARNRDATFYLDCNVETSKEVLLLVQEIGKKYGVKWCEPDMYAGRHVSSMNENPLYSEQYYLRNTGQSGGVKDIDLDIEPAWQVVGGGSSIVVALLDSGIDLEHEDLKYNLLQGYTIGNPTGYGAPQNWTGTNKAHGTACAGILGAADNALGVKGVSYACKILPINIEPNWGVASYNPSGFASNEEIAEAIRWSYENKAKVLSCSWRVPVSNEIAKAINEAVSKNVVVVAASGNYGSSVAFPASLDNVIAVGAIDRKGNIWKYSNPGKELDVVAFGSEIATTDVSGSLGYTITDYNTGFGGTSAACPQVAGIVALMLKANPTLTVADIISILRSTARDLGDKGRDDTYGYGLVDAYAAVIAAKEPTMAIVGPNIVEKKGVYSISNLPQGCTVSWSLTKQPLALNSSGMSVSDDTPQLNSATIYNNTSSAKSCILKATVSAPMQNVDDYVLCRSISGDGILFGYYHEILSDGTITFDVPLLPESSEENNTVSAASDVIVQSDNFWNRQVSYILSDAPYNSRTVQVQENRITFEMPNLQTGQTLIFTVSGGGINSTHSFVFSKENSALFLQDMITIKKTSAGKILVQVGDGTNEIKNTVIKVSPTNTLCEVDIYNAVSLLKVGHFSSNNRMFFIDLANFKNGFYIIKVQTNGQSYSQKISIKN